jgi:hypothetical protein
MLNNDSLAESFGFNKATFIGMFIPNTYEVFWTITSEDIARRFKREFDSFWSGEELKGQKRLVSLLAGNNSCLNSYRRE